MNDVSELNPWKRRDSRLIYENSWIKVREDAVIRPDGSPGIYGVVETRIATGVVAITPELHVFLVGQYRYPTNHYSWEIIEGGTEDHETPLQAIQRELKEEGGLVAETWRELGTEVHLSNCITSEKAVFFLAEGLSKVEAQPDVTEVLQLRLVPFNEALAMIDNGIIKDAMSIIALHRAEKVLKKEGRI